MVAPPVETVQPDPGTSEVTGSGEPTASAGPSSDVLLPADQAGLDTTAAGQASADDAGTRESPRGGQAATRAQTAGSPLDAQPASAGPPAGAVDAGSTSDALRVPDESSLLLATSPVTEDPASVESDDPVDFGGLVAELDPLDLDVILASLSSTELAYLLVQCGPHPTQEMIGCDRGLPIPEPQPVAQPADPEIETAGTQFAPELTAPNPIRAAASAVANIFTSGLPLTGVPDLSVIVLVLVILFVVGLGLRRMGTSKLMPSEHKVRRVFRG